jgi:hypothetical protein
MPEGQEPGSDPGMGNFGGVEGVMLEIDAASSDLGDFIRWIARAADEDPAVAEDFTTTVAHVYSYCRAKNEQGIEDGEDG